MCLRAYRPRAIGIRKFLLPAEFQQRETILRKWRRFCAHFARHTGVVEHRTPHEIWQKYLQQRRESADLFTRTPRKSTDHGGRRPFEARDKSRPALPLRCSKRIGQLNERL